MTEDLSRTYFPAVMFNLTFVTESISSGMCMVPLELKMVVKYTRCRFTLVIRSFITTVSPLRPGTVSVQISPTRGHSPLAGGAFFLAGFLDFI